MDVNKLSSDDSSMLVLFDGDCHFCNFWVRFLMTRDRFRVFRFAPLALVPELPQDSIVVVNDGQFFHRSNAVFKIMEALGVPRWFVDLLRKIPRPLRDGIYDFIANRRYWISKIINSQNSDTCPMPTPLERQKFIYNSQDLRRLLPGYILK